MSAQKIDWEMNASSVSRQANTVISKYSHLNICAQDEEEDKMELGTERENGKTI